MSRLSLLIASFLFAVCSFLPMTAQQNIPSVTSASAAVPNLTRFSGTLTDLNGKPLTGITGVTFSLYKDEQGSAPLWMETQNVTPDKNGRYSVVLGSTTATGLPADVFASGEARWLAVRTDGQEESARVLLVSVPYALKAGCGNVLVHVSDAGSACSLKKCRCRQSAERFGVSTTTTPTGSGTTSFLPLWTSPTQLGSSKLIQTGGNIGVGTTKPAFALDVNGKINSSAGFYLAESEFATGSFSKQNAYIGFAGNSTGSGNQNAALGAGALAAATTSADNAVVGALALNVNTTGSGNGALGASAMIANTTGSENTAVGFQSMELNTTGSFNTALGDIALQGSITASYNTGLGYFSGSASGALYGSGNTFVGAYAGSGGQPNMTNATAIGYKAIVNETNALVLGQPGTLVGIGTSTPTNPLTIQADDNGQSRSGVPHQLQIQGATNPAKQLLIGYLADSLSDAGYGAIQATDSGVKNTWLSLQPVGGQVAIQEAVPVTGAPLEISQTAGNAVAEGWATYSSRRWKNNIETLHGALGKIEKMRGVSYDLKSTGKHEIGVIAEEVGAVVPEIVQWEKNGKDAQSVDYSRMVALLIEGIKEQQALIHKQQSQIGAQQKQIAAQRAQMTQVMSHVKSIESSLRLTREVIAGQTAGQQVTAELHALASSR